MYEHGSHHVGSQHPHTNGSAAHANNSPLDHSVINDLLLHPTLAAKRMSIAAGKALYEPASEAKAIYFIHRGQIRSYKIDEAGSGRLLEILGPDDWCGEAALARHATYGEQAVALVASVVTEASVDRLMPLLAHQPRAAVELIKELSHKLSTARNDAAGLVFDDCNARLLKTLVRFSDSAAAAPHADGGVVLRITHQQLAQAVGVARETVSLALTQLRQRNLLRTGRNQLMFNPDNLRTFVRGRDKTHNAVASEG